MNTTFTCSFLGASGGGGGSLGVGISSSSSIISSCASSPQNPVSGGIHLLVSPHPAHLSAPMSPLRWHLPLHSPLQLWRQSQEHVCVSWTRDSKLRLTKTQKQFRKQPTKTVFEIIYYLTWPFDHTLVVSAQLFSKTMTFSYISENANVFHSKNSKGPPKDKQTKRR